MDKMDFVIRDGKSMSLEERLEIIAEKFESTIDNNHNINYNEMREELFSYTNQMQHQIKKCMNFSFKELFYFVVNNFDQTSYRMEQIINARESQDYLNIQDYAGIPSIAAGSFITLYGARQGDIILLSGGALLTIAGALKYIKPFSRLIYSSQQIYNTKRAQKNLLNFSVVEFLMRYKYGVEFDEVLGAVIYEFNAEFEYEDQRNEDTKLEDKNRELQKIFKLKYGYNDEEVEISKNFKRKNKNRNKKRENNSENEM